MIPEVILVELLSIAKMAQRQYESLERQFLTQSCFSLYLAYVTSCLILDNFWNTCVPLKCEQ